jgi:uncharacterized phage-associated protein
MTTLANAESAARYFVHLASVGERVPLTQMHLHKLLYYAQGVCLASLGVPLFGEAIRAWKHGPVVAEVYPVFRRFGRDPIPSEEGRAGALQSPDARRIVEHVWHRLRPFSALGLRRKSHREAPWRDARGSAGEGERSRAPITTDSMRAWFIQRQDSWFARVGVDRAALTASLAQLKRGEILDSGLSGAHGT